MRRLAALLILATALAGCGGASVIDDGLRGASKGADDVPIPSGPGPEDLRPGAGVGDDVLRAEQESAEARGTLETMIHGDGREWVCLGLDFVEAAQDGDLSFSRYGAIMAEYGYGHIPAYRLRQAHAASVQLLEGDLAQLQSLACV